VWKKHRINYEKLKVSKAIPEPFIWRGWLFLFFDIKNIQRFYCADNKPCEKPADVDVHNLREPFYKHKGKEHRSRLSKLLVEYAELFNPLIHIFQ
jgi:hypothetical protein